METKMRTSITEISQDGTVSVLSQTFIDFNGQEQVLSNHRGYIMPGDFHHAKQLLPENQYNALVALWTP